MNRQKNMVDLIIIGAGASGLMAAIRAREVFEANGKADARILVLDRNEKIGKKLLATGNGRCNLTNKKQGPAFYMTTEKKDSLISEVLERFSTEDVIAFFENAGMKTVDKNGYVYPRSLQAQTVVNKLIELCERRRIEIQTQKMVCRIEKKSDYEIVTEDGNRVLGKALILAVGSQASVHGGYNGYDLAQSFGLKLVTPLPALCGLVADFDAVAFTKQGKSFFKEVSGVRSEVCCKAMINDAIIGSESGELQLTEYGLSGIVIFCLSRYISRALKNRKQAAILVDFIPDMDVETVLAYIQDTCDTETTLFNALSGIFNHKLALGLIKILSGKYYRVQPDVKVQCLEADVLRGFLAELKNFHIEIKDTTGFEKAQVCTGGVALSEVTMDLEVKAAEYLYLCGEVLDVDGICGGYNLQWAWSSGFVAGETAARQLLHHT